MLWNAWNRFLDEYGTVLLEYGANFTCVFKKTIEFNYLEEKEKFIWFHHTWKHEKLTNIKDKISLIGSTKMNFDFAQVKYWEDKNFGPRNSLGRNSCNPKMILNLLIRFYSYF
jgi:hypothetical protein